MMFCINDHYTTLSSLPSLMAKEDHKSARYLCFPGHLGKAYSTQAYQQVQLMAKCLDSESSQLTILISNTVIQGFPKIQRAAGTEEPLPYRPGPMLDTMRGLGNEKMCPDLRLTTLERLSACPSTRCTSCLSSRRPTFSESRRSLE